MSILKVQAIHEPDNDNEALTIDQSGNVTFSANVDMSAGTVTGIDTSNGDTAFSWGDHAQAGYLTTETYTGTLSNVVEDTSPQLGGNLDLNSSNITGTGNISITGNVTAGDVTVDNIVPSTQLSHRNILINGGFDVWQRGTSGFTSIGKEYNADRWWVNQLSTVGTMSRQTASLDGFKYCLRVQRDNGDTSTSATYLNQDLESVNSIKTIGQKVTLSFYARKGTDYSATSDQLIVKVVSGTGTDQTLNNGYTGGANVINQTATLTTSWQRFTYTSSAVVASSVNQLGVQIIRSNVGTAGANDYYEITGVQLEVGSVATPFEHISYGEELAKCKRYFHRNINNLGGKSIGSGFFYNTTTGFTHYDFPVEMRTRPSYSYSSLSDFRVLYGTGVKTATSSGAQIGVTGARIEWIVSGATTGQGFMVDANNSTGYIDFNAEL